MNLTKKYTPKSLKEIPQDTTKLKELILKKQNILINGPAGSCKTSSIYAIANELNYEILELNASDLRNKNEIENIIGETTKQRSLFHKEKIILIDEADGLAGTEDRGGALALANILKETKIPIIITANDAYSYKLKEIKKLTKLIDFPPIKSKNLMPLIKNIAKKENIEITEEDLKKLIINCNGDLRAALNDLESCTINNKFNPELITTRDYEINILNALSIIFKTKSITSARVLTNLNIDLNEYSLWLDENLPLEYINANDLEKAYNKFSRADIFKKRILRWQYWRFMYYQAFLLTSGISLSKSGINKEFTNYKRTIRLLRIWQSNIKNARKKTIAEKLSKLTHTSKNQIIKNFNYYKNYLINVKELELTKEEAEYLHKLI